jgi:ribosomal protein S6--L-glutamate ligase
MKNIIVVNGETDWQEYFPGYQVHSRQIQNSSWLSHQQTLWVFDASGGLRVDAVLWRVGAIKPQPEHRHALELIRMAGIPCLNPATILLKGDDRLSMLNELREAGLPVQTFSSRWKNGCLISCIPTFQPSSKWAIFMEDLARYA